MSNLIDSILKVRNGQMILRRMQWMEAMLIWIGEFNRKNLVDTFSISTQQASSDINLYKKVSNNGFKFNHSKKVFIVEENFSPIFDKTNVLTLLMENKNTIKLLNFESFLMPLQEMPENIFRKLSNSIKYRKPLLLTIFSLKKGTSIQYSFAPHSVIQTSLRWHVRGWNYSQRKFIDIPISRIINAQLIDDLDWVSIEADNDWNEFVYIILEPSNQLSIESQIIIQKIYGMSNNQKYIKVRKCLVFYACSAMSLLTAIRDYRGETKDPNLFLKVKNYKELKPFLISKKIEISSESEQAFKQQIQQLLEHISKYKFDMYNMRVTQSNLQWIGSGLSKIATFYGNEISKKQGFNSESISSIEFCTGMPNISKTPILISMGGKGQDAIAVSKKMASSNYNEIGLICGTHDSICSEILKSEKLKKVEGRFPKKQEMFINAGAIISTTHLTEIFLNTKSDLVISYLIENLDIFQSKAKKIADELFENSNQFNNTVIILGTGYSNSLSHTWNSIMSESGLIHIKYSDIKDYTHGDNRLDSLCIQKPFYLLLDDQFNTEFINRFESVYSKKFAVSKIKLSKEFKKGFWENLLICLFCANYISHMKGYEGKRPPKNHYIHSIYDWGDLTNSFYSPK